MIRIYSKDLTVSKDQRHYLLKVMRLNPNDIFHIFNQTGEYEITAHTWEIGSKIRTIEKLPIRALAFSLIKPTRLSFLIEKSVEVGVTHLFPLITQHGQVSSFKKERFEKIIIEATEQCGRLSPPECYDPIKLKDFIANPTLSTTWFFGDFEAESTAMPKDYGMIIGPEGGFSNDEITLLRQHAKGVLLSSHILRAETAAIVGLSL